MPLSHHQVIFAPFVLFTIQPVFHMILCGGHHPFLACACGILTAGFVKCLERYLFLKEQGLEPT